jgi:alpha-1,2-mannosyltransferase
LPFTYPPAAALFAVPIAILPWSGDQWIWVLAICASLIACIRLAFRPMLETMGRYAVLAAAALFVLFMNIEPMRDELHFGQVDIILLALCVADCLTEEPRWPRGLLTGLATAIKLTPGVFIVYLLVSRRTRAGWTAALSALGWTTLGFVILPADSADYWRHEMLNLNRIGSPTSTSNQSLYGLLLHVSGHSALPLALWLGVAVAVAAAGLACARQVSLSGNEIAGVAIVALLGALLSPISWIHEYVVIVVAIGAIVGWGRSWARAAAAAGTALLFTLPIPYWASRWADASRPPGTLPELVRSEYGLAALLVIGFLWRAGTRGTGPAPPAPAWEAATAVAPAGDDREPLTPSAG